MAAARTTLSALLSKTTTAIQVIREEESEPREDDYQSDCGFER